MAEWLLFSVQERFRKKENHVFSLLPASETAGLLVLLRSTEMKKKEVVFLANDANVSRRSRGFA